MSHLLIWPTVTFFYPVGNTSAVCLTENLLPESNAEVLLLACGDPRHILYTIHSETSPLMHSRAFDITCCDVDPAVLARNALLFTLLADDGIQDTQDSLWNLFYHMFIDQPTMSILLKQCRKLIPLAESTKTWRAGPYGHFLTTCDAATLAELRRIWTAYLSTGSLSRRQAKRFEQRFTNGMKDVSRRLGFGGTTTAGRSAGPFWLHAQESVARQFTSYWSSGVTDDRAEGKGQRRRLTFNPTFAFSIDGDKFAVHYGTDPLSGFHLAEAFTSGKFTCPLDRIPLHKMVRTAKAQFARWCTSMSNRLKASNPSSSTFIIRMYAGDALLFCHALKYCEVTRSPITPYDVAAWRMSTITLDDHYYGRNAVSPAPLSFSVIDTSNLMDHAGLLNVLVATAPLLCKNPSATLYTEALLRTGDNPSQAILKHVFGELPIMSLLLGIIPSTFISHFNTRSNMHEIITMSENATQFHERLAWKAIGLNNGSTPPQRLCFSPEDLAKFLFRTYLHMFSDENVGFHLQLLTLSPERLVEVLQRSGVPHYNRRSFALLVHFVQSRVTTDWAGTMDMFEDLVLTSGQLMMGDSAYQELCCQLHLLGVYTTPCIPGPSLHNYPDSDIPELFRDWTRTRIQQVVTLVLVVPRDAIAKLEPEFMDIGTPALQCGVHAGPYESWFAVTSATFGTLRVSGVGENRVGVIVEGNAGTDTPAVLPQPLWRTGAPLIITFSALSGSVIDFARNPSATIGLALRRTMAVARKFTDKLGFSLTVFRTLLKDANHAYVLARRPVVDNGGDMRTVMADHWHVDASQGKAPDEIPGSNVSVRLNAATSAILSFTMRIDVTDPGARAALASVETTPTLCSSTGSPRSLDASLTIGTHEYPVRFPLPVDVAHTKLRVARKSSYIEVIVPPAPFEVRPERDLSNRFASLSLDASDTRVPTLGSIHRVNLDRCPEFKLSRRPSVGNWCDWHINFMFSDSERRRVFRANSSSISTPIPDVLVHVKQTLHVLLRSASGTNPDGNALENVFALFDTSCQASYAYIIVARMCLDVGSHTLVADAFVAPPTPPVRYALSTAMRDAIMSSSNGGQPRHPDDVAVRYIGTDADETAAWFHLLPRLTERCRTWSHKTTCAYRNSKQDHPLKPADVPLGAWGQRSPLCTCGEGIGTEVLPKELKRVAPYLTRAAFSPLFSVPYLEEVVVPVEGPATAVDPSQWQKNTPKRRHCQSCGKEGSLRCSRCQSAQYCSKTCQLADWKSHKKSCGPPPV